MLVMTKGRRLGRLVKVHTVYFIHDQTIGGDRPVIGLASFTEVSSKPSVAGIKGILRCTPQDEPYSGGGGLQNGHGKESRGRSIPTAFGRLGVVSESGELPRSSKPGVSNIGAYYLESII